MLHVRQIECTRGNRRLFHDLSFRLDAKQALQVAGENGSGKSSLLRMVAGLSPVDAGEIFWNGERIGRLGESFLRELSFIGHANALKDDLSAIENLRHAMALAGSAASNTAMRDVLDQHGLGAVAHLPVRVLSQGQKRRAALCRLAFSQDRPLWILDEPLAALDTAAVDRVTAIMAAQIARGGMVIFTTHQPVELTGTTVQSLALGGN